MMGIFLKMELPETTSVKNKFSWRGTLIVAETMISARMNLWRVFGENARS